MVLDFELTGGSFNSIKSFEKGPLEVGALEWGKVRSCFNCGRRNKLEERGVAFEMRGPTF